jgi:hypothetical protein
MRPRETTDGLLRSRRNLTKYLPSARLAIIAFAKQKSAEFQAEGGRFRAPKMMSGFASFNAATKTINLSRSEMADAKLAALVEELIHFRQAQAADVFGKESGWFSRYTLQEWRELSPVLEAEVDEAMAAMGFEE